MDKLQIEIEKFSKRMKAKGYNSFDAQDYFMEAYMYWYKERKERPVVIGKVVNKAWKQLLIDYRKSKGLNVNTGLPLKNHMLRKTIQYTLDRQVGKHGETMADLLVDGEE